MGYIEIHFEKAHETIASKLADAISEYGVDSELIVRNSDTDAYDLLYFLRSNLGDHKSHIFLIASTSTFKAGWMRNEIETVNQFLSDEEYSSISKITFGLNNDETHKAFPLRGEPVTTISLDCSHDSLRKKLNFILPKVILKNENLDSSPPKFKSLEDLHTNHQDFISTILSTSGNKDFLKAVQAWSIDHIGFSSDAHKCQLCGKQINYYANIVNNQNSAVLLIGLVCFRHLVSALNAENVFDVFGKECVYRQKQRRKTLDRIFENIADAEKKDLSGIDYSSWKRWFIEMDEAGNLPEELKNGINELTHIGVLGNDSLIDKFIKFHNENRQFPSHMLLPLSRLRGWLDNPESIPINITVNQAKQIKYRTKQQFSDLLVSKIALLFDGQDKPHQSQLKMVYNFVITLYRGYQGCSNNKKRYEYLQSHPLLASNPAFIDKKGNRIYMVLEFRTLVKLLAELAFLAFKQYCAEHSEQYMEILMNRLDLTATTGRVSPLWPLATEFPEQSSDENQSASDAYIRYLTQFFDKSDGGRFDLSPEPSKDITHIINEEWRNITGHMPIDITLAGAWIISSYRCSDIIVRLKQTHCDLVIGLNECWRKANLEQLHAIIRTILRDICQHSHQDDQYDLEITQRFLNSINLTPKSNRNLSQLKQNMNAISALRNDFNFDLDSSMDIDRQPAIVIWDQRKTPIYFRWAHVFMFPESYFSDGTQGKKRFFRTLSHVSSLAPESFRPYKRPRSSKSQNSLDSWFDLDSKWIIPESNIKLNGPTLGWLKPISPPISFRLTYPSGRNWNPKLGRRQIFLELPESKRKKIYLFYNRNKGHPYADSLISIQVKGQLFIISIEKSNFPLEVVGTEMSIYQGETAEIDCGSVLRWPPQDLLLQFY